AGGVIPLWWQRLRSRPDSGAAKATAGLELRDSVAVLTLTGRFVGVHADVLREAFVRAAAASVPRVRVDLAAVDQIDAAAIGLLLLLRAHQRDAGGSLELIGARRAVQRQLRWHGAEYLLTS
ncbi:MAG TPA: STAS domain-containing protein, partial [Albitalea sp.]|nr:STAS domain-containing protein [Albitalea sp.]